MTTPEDCRAGAPQPAPPGRDTAYAPAARVGLERVAQQRAALADNPLALSMLEAIPTPAVILNMHRQIVAANRGFLSMAGGARLASVLGQRTGEALACLHSDEHPGGCGTSRACSKCGAVNAVLESTKSRGRAARECRIATRSATDGGALELLVQCSFLESDGQPYTLLAAVDVSAHKRRRLLEQTFLHDVLNDCKGIRGIAETLAGGPNPEVEKEFKGHLLRVSGAMIDDITAHRHMLAAERGELRASLEDVKIRLALEEMVSVYRTAAAAEQHEILVGDCADGTLRTDAHLLRRVLGCMVKNALEAAPWGEPVALAARSSGGRVEITVHNPGFIPEDIQLQIFQRSFTTREGEGRGIGTYSARLFGERYLGGKVSFVSTPEAGTVFTFSAPLAGPTPLEAAA